jgi:hypothetical protein
MELQQDLQHSLEKCQFRLEMYAWRLCGRWIRDNQIVDNLLMVDPATTTTMRVGSSTRIRQFLPLQVLVLQNRL